MGFSTNFLAMVDALTSRRPPVELRPYLKNKVEFTDLKKIEKKTISENMTLQHRENTLFWIRLLSYGGLSDVCGGIVSRGVAQRRGAILKTSSIVNRFDSCVSW
mmetsp:Transcript_3746/g.5101  ORF Transcript_3746/g.5101 Transcript_3746/m.5101 type:complete len:104 (-) Transcript_3746:935-1246(-)